MRLEEIVKKIRDIDNDIAKEGSEVKKLTSEVLDKMSSETHTECNICVSLGAIKLIDSEDDYECYLCYESGIFNLRRDQDPDLLGPELRGVEPERIEDKDLVEIVNQFPEAIKSILQEIKTRKEDFNEAKNLLKKMVEVT
ncbi:MAG: hypothetical protein GYA51_15115 [Candidatus Methanofastidiosa archaeon]|nr:hypothetical protein [Candidatus Methanofastidiosa archaeon]